MYARIHDVTDACRDEDSGAATAADNAATVTEEIHAASTEAAAAAAAATKVSTERVPNRMPPQEEPPPQASFCASSLLLQVCLFLILRSPVSLRALSRPPFFPCLLICGLSPSILNHSVPLSHFDTIACNGALLL